MALKCCNKLCQLIETITLYDTITQRHRVLVIGRCKNPKCGCLKGEFIYWDTKEGKFIHNSIPKSDLKEVIARFKKYPNLTYQKDTKKRGSFTNMNWRYQKNGSMYDFNDMLIMKLNAELRKYNGK